MVFTHLNTCHRFTVDSHPNFQKDSIHFDYPSPDGPQVGFHPREDHDASLALLVSSYHQQKPGGLDRKSRICREVIATIWSECKLTGTIALARSSVVKQKSF